MIKRFDKEGRIGLPKEVRALLGDNVNVEIVDGVVQLSPTNEIIITTDNIKSSYIKASSSTRDFSKEGRINEHLTNAIGSIVNGLEGICSDYDNDALDAAAIKDKVHQIKEGIENLEFMINVIED